MIIFWLKHKKASTWFIIPSAILMLLLPGHAMFHQLFVGENSWLLGTKPNYLLSSFGILTVLIEFWIINEAITAWKGQKQEA